MFTHNSLWRGADSNAFTFLRLVDFGPGISNRTREICKINTREDRKDIPEGKKVFRHVKVSGRGLSRHQLKMVIAIYTGHAPAYYGPV